MSDDIDKPINHSVGGVRTRTPSGKFRVVKSCPCGWTETCEGDKESHTASRAQALAEEHMQANGVFPAPDTTARDQRIAVGITSAIALAVLVLVVSVGVRVFGGEGDDEVPYDDTQCSAWAGAAKNEKNADIDRIAWQEMYNKHC